VTATVPCPQCGANNRIDRAKAQKLQPVCGRCGVPLPLPAVVEITDARFEEDVLKSSLPVLLDVWAPWCAPCRGMEPVILDLAATLSGRVRVAKLNADRNPATLGRLQIQGIPTLVVFKDGREITRMVGARAKPDILRALAGVS
jgi:thioredoxin 2